MLRSEAADIALQVSARLCRPPIPAASPVTSTTVGGIAVTPALVGRSNHRRGVEPNVSRDGLTIVSASNRGGNMDIYMSTRSSLTSDWSAPAT